MLHETRIQLHCQPLQGGTKKKRRRKLKSLHLRIQARKLRHTLRMNQHQIKRKQTFQRLCKIHRMAHGTADHGIRVLHGFQHFGRKTDCMVDPHQRIEQRVVHTLAECFRVAAECDLVPCVHRVRFFRRNGFQPRIDRRRTQSAHFPMQFAEQNAQCFQQIFVIAVADDACGTVSVHFLKQDMKGGLRFFQSIFHFPDFR